MFGIRDVALAVGALTSNGTAHRMWLQLGVLCDAVDAAASILAARDGAISTRTCVLATVPPLLAIGLGIASMIDSSAEA